MANNQVQFSLLDRRPLNGMIDYCMANGIKVGVIWGSDESTTEDQVVVHMAVAAWWQTAGCSWSGGGDTTHPLTHQLQKVSVDTSYLSRSGCGGPDNQQARVKKMEVCSAQLVSVRLPQPCAGPTSTLTKHYDSRPSTHGPHSVGCRCGCDTVAVKALWATSDTHGVATPVLLCAAAVHIRQCRGRALVRQVCGVGATEGLVWWVQQRLLLTSSARLFLILEHFKCSRSPHDVHRASTHT